MLPVYSFDLANKAQRAFYSFQAGEALQGILVTDPGGKEENQDVWGCTEALDGSLIFCAADGLGGHIGSKLAAQCAVYGALSVTKTRDFDGLGPSTLRDMFRAAQAKVVQAKEKDPALKAMRSTLVVLVIKKNMARWGHIGDARLYLLRNNKILVQTKDQSVPQMLVDVGDIKPEELRRHPERKRLVQALGSTDQKIKPILHENPEAFNPGDLFVLSTDGFWEWIDELKLLTLSEEEDISNAVLKSEKIIRKLAAVEGADYDNYTAMFLRKRELSKDPKYIKKLWSRVSFND